MPARVQEMLALTTAAPDTSRPERIKLPVIELRRGERAQVQSTEMPAADAELLRAMGLREGAQIRVCRMGHPCIVELCDERCGTGCRIGIAQDLAARVMVCREG